MIHQYKALQQLIQSDEEYAWALFCNIAIPIMDSMDCSHRDANEAAAFLMSHLWDYDITKDARYEYGKSAAQEYAEMRIAAEREEDADLADEAGI